MPQAITLKEFNERLARCVMVPETQNVWVTAELSDVRQSGGHCYMELLEKNSVGVQVAKIRGIIWSSNFRRISAEFFAATGQRIESNIKVMARVSATMHPIYGLSLVISDINPEFTMGDLLLRRKAMVEQLRAEGILNLNRELPWPEFPHRIALISAAGAAGYGDFINQLFTNGGNLRFDVRLFPAIMQGRESPGSIISALEDIASDIDRWDAVAIIRGGGATSDLQAFEDYNLAASIAQFPIPVVIGLGHERDVCLLDYVANIRAKTPTAAADVFVDKGLELLDRINSLGNSIIHTATGLIAGAKEQLSYCEGLLPIAPLNALESAKNRLHRAVMTLNQLGASRIAPALERLRIVEESLPRITADVVGRQRTMLDDRQRLLDALSPHAVLARGYSLTTVGGRAVRSVDALSEGEAVETIFADGSVTSVINSISKDKK